MSGTGANLPVRIQVEGGAQAEAAFNAVAATGERAMQRVGTATGQAAVSGGTLRNAIGSAGYQLQDFAVQVQGGTSALTALSQQGSQFLGVFGPAGAIAGAVLTVGILAGQLLTAKNSTDEAKDAMDAFAKAMADAARDGTRLADVMARVEARFISIQEAARQQRIRAINTDVQELGRLGVDATMRAANRDNDAMQSEARRSFLAGQLDRGLSFTDENEIRREIRELDGAIQAARRDAENARAEVARLDFNRDRTSNLLRGEYEDGTNVNPGRPDPPERETARGGRARAIREGIDLEAVLAANVRESTQAVNDFNTALNLNDAGLSAAQGALSRYDRDMQMLETALARGVLTETEFTAAVEASTLALGRQIEEVQRRGVNADALGRELGMTFSSAFEDAIVKGAEFSDVLKGIEQDLARLVIRQAITAPLSGAISGAIKGIDFGNIVSNLFPGRADGGPVSMGTTYLVGERGPELFTPGASGNITPNHAMGGAITYSPTINVDARGSDAATLARARIEAQAIAQASIAQFADSIQRGGGAARLVGRR